MSETKWTDEQLQAIMEKDCNLLVAAAAGAGKTTVLVERIIRKITCHKDPIDIDKLLIVTFTNAAATEMRERISDAISKALDQNPESTLLQRQIALLNKSNIMTIHSFCLDVIKNNFHYIDLNPGFRIADETEAILLKIEALDNLFENIYSEENIDPEFFDLLESYSGNRDDQALKDLVLTLYEFIQSYPWPSEWLNEKTSYFDLINDDFAHTLWGKILIENAVIELTSLKEMMLKAISIIEEDQGLGPYLANFQTEKDGIELLLKVSQPDKLCKTQENIWDNLYGAIQNITFKRLPTCKKDVDKDQREYVKSLRDKVKAQIKKLQQDIFVGPSDQVISDLEHVYPLIKHLSQMVIKFGLEYSEQKRNKSLLDFNDLEHFCLEILTKKNQDGSFLPSNAAIEYKKKFEEILVDEYQDSNMVQEIILNTISKKDMDKPNIFMVGDVKQSIYRFRQAKPELFLEKYNTYSVKEGDKYRKIQLYKNFRSREKVIDFVNFIFGKIMSEQVGELDYNDEEALNFGANYKKSDKEYIIGGSTELHLIEMEGEESVGDTGYQSQYQDEYQDEYQEQDSYNYTENGANNNNNNNNNNDNELMVEEPIDNIKSEARVVGQRIKTLMQEFGVMDSKTKEYRSVEYKDIVILLRTTRNWSDVFVEELSQQGIPIYADVGTGFFKTIEVQIVLSLLQIIDNPMQDIPLLAVLRAPFLGFTSDEMTDIRLADKESTLYEALVKICSPEIDDDENCQVNDDVLVEKARQFLKTLEKWREKELYLSTDELIWYLYTDTGFFSYVGAMPGGEQRQANLRMLFEQARKFEETSYKGLFNFVNFINKIKSSRGDMGSAKILGENENVVRIMSIHKSKGLEFPIVFLSGCGKGFNMQDLNKKIILHQELGFGPDYVDYKKRITYPTLAKQALRYQIKKESLSEEMRILYVAFTRAKEKLILTGTIKDLSKSILKWSESSLLDKDKIPSYAILKGRNLLDWICPALMQHEDYNFDLLDQETSHDTNIPDANIKVWKKANLALGLNSGVDAINIQGSQNDQNDDDDDNNNNNNSNQINQKETGNEINSSMAEVSRRLNWEYEYKQATTVPIKISVTELKRAFHNTSEEYPAYQVYSPTLVKKPAFLEESKGLNRAEIGTILHFVMQCLDLKSVGGIDEIDRQIKRMIKDDLITKQEATYVDINKIYRFFNSNIGKRMLKSGKIYREIPFNIQIDSKEIMNQLKLNIESESKTESRFESKSELKSKSKSESDCESKSQPESESESQNGEKILLQGVIDCFFEEDDFLVLLDYKTDYISPNAGAQAIEVIKQRYGVQLDYYSMVLERLLKKKVKEKYIYLFWNGETVSL